MSPPDAGPRKAEDHASAASALALIKLIARSGGRGDLIKDFTVRQPGICAQPVHSDTHI